MPSITRATTTSSGDEPRDNQTSCGQDATISPQDHGLGQGESALNCVTQRGSHLQWQDPPRPIHPVPSDSRSALLQAPLHTQVSAAATAAVPDLSEVHDLPPAHSLEPPSSSASPAFPSTPVNPNSEMILPDFHQDHLDIVLPSDTLTFRGVGQNYEPALLQGNVVLQLPEATNIREITLTFYCKARIPNADGRQPHVRYHQTTHTIFTHDWSFLEGAKNHRRTLKAGQHVFPFTLELESTLPSTVTTPHASIAYKLRATVIRSAFSVNWVCQKPVNVVRAFVPEALEYHQTLEIENTWPGKIMYSIMIPHKAFAAGDEIPILLKFSPMAKGVSVLSIGTTIKEYVSIHWKGASVLQDSRTVAWTKHVIRNGHAITATAVMEAANSNETSPSSSARGPSFLGRAAASTRSSMEEPTTSGSSISRLAALSSAVLLAPGLAREDWQGENNSASTTPEQDIVGDQDIDTSIKVPISVIATPTHSTDPITVVQKIKFSVVLSNIDGHTSELRCALPIHILSHSLLQEARQATQETRNLLFGLENGPASPSINLPSYASHVHDRVANALDGIESVATLGPNPLHNLDRSAPPTAPVTPYAWSPSTSPSGNGSYLPSSWEYGGLSSPPRSPPNRNRNSLTAVGEDLHALTFMDSGLLLSLGESAVAAASGSSSRTDTPPESIAAYHRASRVNSRVNSRASSRAPSPDRSSILEPSHRGGAAVPGSAASLLASHPFFGHGGAKEHHRSGGLLHHLAQTVKPFRSKKHGGSVSNLTQFQPFMPHTGQHPISPPASRPPTRPSSRTNLRAEFNGEQPAMHEGQLMTELLNRVPDYERASRGFLGGGVTPLESSAGLPTYDEVDRVSRVRSEGALLDYRRTVRASNITSTRPADGDALRMPTPEEENESEVLTMRHRIPLHTRASS